MTHGLQVAVLVLLAQLTWVKNSPNSAELISQQDPNQWAGPRCIYVCILSVSNCTPKITQLIDPVSLGAG